MSVCALSIWKSEQAYMYVRVCIYVTYIPCFAVSLSCLYHLLEFAVIELPVSPLSVWSFLRQLVLEG